jgi:CSLREA domain-containing protein
MRRIGRVCAVTLAVLGHAAPGLAATFTVTATADRTDADPADDLCDSDLATPGEQCTLRAAVQQANSATTAC